MLPLILASSSSARLDLLSQIKIIPDKVIHPDIDETQLSKELPRQLALRLSKDKGMKVANIIDSGYIIAADSVICVGRRVLDKALTDVEVEKHLSLLSGRRHKSYTAVTVIKKENNSIVKRTKVIASIVKVKRLTKTEIREYVNSKEGLNQAGGYSVFGLFQKFMLFVNGSISSIMGLPIYQTYNLLMSLGYKNK